MKKRPRSTTRRNQDIAVDFNLIYTKGIEVNGEIIRLRYEDVISKLANKYYLSCTTLEKIIRQTAIITNDVELFK